MELADFVNQISTFDAMSQSEKIRIFAWFMHKHRNAALVSSTDVRGCYDELHVPAPNIAMYLARMTEAKPPKALRKGNGYILTRVGRSDLDTKYGTHQTFIQVSKLLNDLPGKICNAAERNFLTEAIKCYKAGAFRATVIMTWNLAYSHLLNWILKDPARLAKFSVAIPKRYPKKPPITIGNYDDFVEQLKESEVIDLCNSASLLNSNIIKILKEKLGKRNICAHPSTVTVVQSQADDVVTDLVNNVVVTLT